MEDKNTICVVCRWRVFRSQVIAAFLRKLGLRAEAYAIEDTYVGTMSSEIRPSLFSRIEKEFNIKFSEQPIKIIDNTVAKHCDVIILAEEKLRNKLPVDCEGSKVIELRKMIGREFPDLKGKDYEAHAEFARTIEENLPAIIRFLREYIKI